MQIQLQKLTCQNQLIHVFILILMVTVLLILFDKEPNTPAGSVVSGGGVAMDLDKIIRDAIKNNLPKDECEALFSNIEFDTDKAIIRDASKETLSKVIELVEPSHKLPYRSCRTY